MPARAEVDPSKLKRQLPYLYIAQVTRQDGDHFFKISLMGTELVEILKQEGKDRYVRELDLGGFESSWRQSLLYALSTKAPTVAVDRVHMKTGLVVELEHLVMPLSDNDQDVDRFIGCLDFLGHDDAWIRERLDHVDWSTVIDLELPKRLVITNLNVPLE